MFRAARAAFGHVPPFLVPAHPIAGTEHSGVEASFASLFEARRVILTPGDATAPAAVDRVEAMWCATGAETDRMKPDRHDEVLASVSHLPHLLAYVLVDLVASGTGDPLRYAAGDFATSAASHPPTP